MNERINQLRLEAGISRLQDEPKFMVAVNEEGTVIEPLSGLEKFAELIVQECAELVSCNGHVSGFALGDLIKQHFGVEL